MNRGIFILGILLVIGLGVYLDAVEQSVFIYTVLSLVAYFIVCVLYIRAKDDLDV